MLECPICMDTISLYDLHKKSSETDYDIVGELVPCHHKFHSECIRQWHTVAPDLKCPVCRTLSISMTVTYDSNTGFERKIQVHLKKGFLVDTVLQYEGMMLSAQHPPRDNDLVEHPEELEIPSENGINVGLASDFRSILTVAANEGVESESEEDVLALSPEPDIGNDLMCKICGDDEEIPADTRCPSCDFRYHESCLHSTACEVGEGDTWQQCIECRTLVTHINKIRERSTEIPVHQPRSVPRQPRTAPELSSQQIAKILDSKTKIQKHVRNQLRKYYNSSDVVQITKEEFLTINRTVSRSLYALSDNEYNKNIDYDTHAKRAISVALHKLGYMTT